MDIRNLLNPMDEHVEGKRLPSTVSIGNPYFHAKPEPVEVGGCYVTPYSTPVNGPVQQYSITALPSHSPQYGPLPSVNHLLEKRPSSAEHNTHQSVSPHHRSRSHRSNRAERDYLHRVACTPPSPPLVASLESMTETFDFARTLHSNDPYRPEHVAWFRYHKIDLKRHWKDISEDFEIMFAGERLKVTKDGLSSRLYRHNILPEIDREGNFVYDEKGKIKLMEMRVRIKDIGKYRVCPWTLVERHPWAALQYDWVRPEHKLKAANIIAGIEMRNPSKYTLRQKYVVAIRKYETIKEASRHWKQNQSK